MCLKHFEGEMCHLQLVLIINEHMIIINNEVQSMAKSSDTNEKYMLQKAEGELLCG